MLPEKLVLLNAVVRKSKSSSVLARLLHSGFFHPFDAVSVPGMAEYLQTLKQDSEASKWNDTGKRLNNILNETGFKPHRLPEPVSYGEAETVLALIEENLKPLFEKKHKIQKEISDLQNLFEKKIVYLPIPVSSYTFIHTEIGEIKLISLAILENMLESIPHILIPAEEKNGNLVVGVIILKKDLSTFERIKKEIGWLPVSQDIFISDIPVDTYREKEKKLKLELEEIDSEIHRVIERNRDILERIATSIEIFEKLSIARKHLGTTETTTVISGWIPAQQQQKAKDIVTGTDPLGYCQCINAEDTGVNLEQVPVMLRHNRFLKPFEIIVRTYGLPRYRTIDPTLFVAFSFLLMFGAMFGDIGQGIVFILSGLFMLWRAKGIFGQAGFLVACAGISSTIFGFLYGSFFGIEFHPLWINPMEDISTMFKVCIIIGATILTAGIVLNIINQIINRDKAGFLFDRAGIFSGLIFWTGAAIAGLYISKTGTVMIKIISAIFVACILTIFLKSVFESFRQKEGILVGFIEGFLHVFEIMMGYLANTMSFIRIAAFALNHFGFFMTIFAISDMLKKTGMYWASWLAIVSGNIFVIVLEGLVVMIQALRLNYYEFFSRFFVPGNNAYQPLVIEGSVEKIEQYLT